MMSERKKRRDDRWCIILAFVYLTVRIASRSGEQPSQQTIGTAIGMAISTTALGSTPTPSRLFTLRTQAGRPPRPLSQWIEPVDLGGSNLWAVRRADSVD